MLLPFLLQAITIGIDEVWFHWKRSLPKWERIGHPIDTMTVILCIGYVLLVPFSKQAILPYCLLAVLSCLIVTKDEFVHKTHCCAAENWFHAVLFLLHPIVLVAAGLIWPVIWGAEPLPWLLFCQDSQLFFASFMKCQLSALALFMGYQVIFWNFVWKS